MLLFRAGWVKQFHRGQNSDSRLRGQHEVCRMSGVVVHTSNSAAAGWNRVFRDRCAHVAATGIIIALLTIPSGPASAQGRVDSLAEQGAEFVFGVMINGLLKISGDYPTICVGANLTAESGKSERPLDLPSAVFQRLQLTYGGRARVFQVSECALNRFNSIDYSSTYHTWLVTYVSIDAFLINEYIRHGESGFPQLEPRVAFEPNRMVPQVNWQWPFPVPGKFFESDGGGDITDGDKIIVYDFDLDNQQGLVTAKHITIEPVVK